MKNAGGCLLHRAGQRKLHVTHIAGRENPRNFDGHDQPTVCDPVTVIITGEPVAKGRPRMTRRGFAYTPSATRKFEAHGRLAAQLAMDGRPPIQVPVRVELLIELPIPTSWSERKRAAAIVGDVRPTSRPDLDNFLKAILDAINTIVVADDAQIVEVCATKKFGIAPKMVATVFPLDAASSNRRAQP
jgi:Holliday junction resolvase RusA-like endonuclease